MTPSDSEKLEPCPFCGGPADAIARVDPGYEPDVHCRKSDCGGYAETVTAWNTRAPDSDRQQGGVGEVETAARAAYRACMSAWSCGEPYHRVKAMMDAVERLGVALNEPGSEIAAVRIAGSV